MIVPPLKLQICFKVQSVNRKIVSGKAKAGKGSLYVVLDIVKSYLVDKCT